MPFYRARCWWTVSGIAVDGSAEQGRSFARSAVLELADDALSRIAHRVDRADHLLLADHDLVEQAFELRRDARVDQRRIGLFENPEQRRPAYTLPYRRFADVLADACARIGGDVDCYSFIAVDFHHILLASLLAHSLALRPAHSRGHRIS